MARLVVSLLVFRFTWSDVCWIIEGECVRITCSALVWKQNRTTKQTTKPSNKFIFHRCFGRRPSLVFLFVQRSFFLRSCFFGVRTLVSAPWMISIRCGQHGTAWHAHCATFGSPATNLAWARQSSESCGTSGRNTDPPKSILQRNSWLKTTDDLLKWTGMHCAPYSPPDKQRPR